MSSAYRENLHVKLLNKLLADSMLECLRTPVESTESSFSSEGGEEQGPAEAEEEHAPEEAPEEETEEVLEEEEVESLPDIFPTPSLRLVLPDHVREIEKQNRIHVLPEEFKTEINPDLIPKILSTPQQRYIDILAELTGCTSYKNCRAEFWFLDTLANLLRRAQEDGLDRPTQAILILWFCQWMKEMQYFDAADRTRMMRRFQDNMIAASKYIVEMDLLPTPAQAGVYYKAQEPLENVDPVPRSEPTPSGSKTKVHFGNIGPNYECCMRDLTKIIHYIYDLFSTDYQYNLVRSVFTFTPEYSLIDAPNQIQNPKTIYAPPKPQKPEKSPKTKEKQKTDSASKQKKIKDEILDPGYLEFLEKKAEAYRRQEEDELLEMEKWNRKSHILPLGFAATDELFDKYWPPPPPLPPGTVPASSEVSKKGKKGKK